MMGGTEADVVDGLKREDEAEGGGAEEGRDGKEDED